MRGETGGSLIVGARPDTVKGPWPTQYQRAALLLALVRVRLPASQFASLLRLHQTVGWCLQQQPLEPGRAILWEAAMRRTLDQVRFEVVRGGLSPGALKRLVHTYGHALADDGSDCILRDASNNMTNT